MEGKFICKCDCGGDVRGVEQFGRLFTWCEACTPVVVVDAKKFTSKAPEHERPVRRDKL